ncbi:hypothetical protein Bca52824_083731 [Brassica carinata]|uniref:Uncharacterized protein n=1 Tax=Brassica carinata TaxID=52824 RepID=A0A8X7PLB2_BRACI|nr:hypothetical protein Bca52824_083731 [Brassica carinata]
MVSGLINENPIVYEIKERRDVRAYSSNTDELSVDAIDQLEVFDILLFAHHIRDIKDPEHPYSLEQLKVLTEDSVEVDDTKSHPVCAELFFSGLHSLQRWNIVAWRPLSVSVSASLMRSLPSRYKIDIRVAPGTHATEAAVNKQLNDKERVGCTRESKPCRDGR